MQDRLMEDESFLDETEFQPAAAHAGRRPFSDLEDSFNFFSSITHLKNNVMG